MISQKLAIFDFNGTILNDTDICVIAGAAEFEYLGLPPLTREKMRDTFDFPIIHFFERNGVNAAKYLENVETLTEIFYNTYEMHVEDAPLHEGIFEILDWLDSQGFVSIILSNEVQTKLEGHLKRLNLIDRFEIILGNSKTGMVTSKLNKQERLEAYLSDKDIDLSQSFIIGDSLEEPQIAKNLNLTCVSVSAGHIAHDRIAKANPDILEYNLLDAYKALKALYA